MGDTPPQGSKTMPAIPKGQPKALDFDEPPGSPSQPNTPTPTVVNPDAAPNAPSKLNGGKKRRTKKVVKPKRGKKSRKPKRGKKSRKTRNTKRTKRR